MEINSLSTTQIPKYEQIENQIKEMILSGVYSPGAQLPSIRTLARELKVGIVTCRRAYDDLCEQGILVSYPGKGVFVGDIKTDKVKEINITQLKKQLQESCDFARAAGIKKEEIISIIEELFLIL